jgi:hypothetical protein
LEDFQFFFQNLKKMYILKYKHKTISKTLEKSTNITNTFHKNLIEFNFLIRFSDRKMKENFIVLFETKIFDSLSPTNVSFIQKSHQI